MHIRTFAARARAHRRSIVKTAFLALVLLAGVATNAFAAGSISGTVTSSTTTLGLQGTGVQVYDLNGNGDGPFATATTDATGFYTINLPAGSYAVFTQDTHGYINEIWDNIKCSAVCDVNSITPIDVTTGAITNINFVLDPGTRISGTVTSSAGGAPIANVTVLFADPGGNVAFTKAVTDASGNYTTEGGSETGNVFAVTENAQGYRNEIYNNKYCLNCDPTTSGDPIAVTLGVPKTGIDFVLDPGGRITGNVTDANLSPLANVEVRIYDSAGNTVDTPLTDGSGNFSTAGLPAGTYYAGTSNALGLVDKIYNNIVCAGGFCNATNGTPISVTVPNTTANINFVLPPGGTVSGTVTAAAGGAPLQNVFVGLTNSSGTFVGGANTDVSGAYATGAVPAGTYYATVQGVAGFVGQVYNGLPCNPCNPVTTGNGITVTVNNNTGNINFALVTAGAITGTVTDASLNPVSNFQVQVFSSGGGFLGSTNTNASGVYTLSGLATGSYYVKTNGGGNLINQLYNGVTCVGCNVTTSGGSLVSVTAGFTTGSINFTLSTGGRISGTVTNAANAAVLPNVQVQVFNASGTGMGTVTTNGSGIYTTQGLPAGTYYLRTSNSQGFVNELYDNLTCPGTGCTVTTGTPVTVTASTTTTGKDFALASGGTIGGTVTNAANAAPIQNVQVQIFNSSGLGLGNVNTDSSGNYLTSGLPAGTYYIRTFNTLGFVDELYDDISCIPGCTVTTGAPIVVSVGTTQSGKNFALASGGSISGTVKDAGTLANLASVSVSVYTSGGSFTRSAATNGSGVYTVSGLTPGTYYARTSVSNSLYYFDELYSELPCAPSCTVTSGTAIAVTAGNTQSGVNFTLTSGAGTIAGTVTDAGTLAGIGAANVQVYSSGGAFVKSVAASFTGAYSVAGLSPGTYYVRTSIIGGAYVDKLYNDLPCFPSCTVTAGTPVVVTAGATTGGINFALRPNLVRNGRFDNGTTNWLPYATPDMSYISYGVVNGVFEFTRVAPPPGTSNQAVIFQETNMALAAQAPLLARFDLGNSSSVRKRISVLVIDGNFSDLSVCTFWLPPNSPLATYQMRTHTTKAWTNAAIYFYAATAGSNGGSYRLDNVSLESAPSQPSDRTDCVDPTAPAPPGGTASATLLTNGDFTTGQLTPWGLYGQITSQIAGGVFEFYRPAGTPAGVVLQNTGQAMTANEILTANFQLGNSSPVRKRVTVLLHDNDFSDLTACTFWLEPGQALSNYAVRSFSTKAWTNTTLSVYPATVGADQWIQLDNATLQRTPAATILGTECGEPGVAPLAPDMDVQVP